MAFNIKIDFDYFYNKLSNADKLTDLFQPGSQARATVQQAANVWASFIDEDFVEVPMNTSVKVGNTATSNFPNIISGTEETITLNAQNAIDDLTIFIGTRTDMEAPGNIAQAGSPKGVRI